MIKTSEFVKSSANWRECPEPSLPEYAFIGRSNVGKSSLINALLGRKNLAKTSQTPGKTQLVNHFLINENWYLTDLPGYGYAKVSKQQRASFEKLINGYIQNRSNLVKLYILIDARHDAQLVDLEFLTYCAEISIPFSIVFTKTDKLRPNAVNQNTEKYLQKLSETWEPLPEYFTTSAITKFGIPEILEDIVQTNAMLASKGVHFSKPLSS